jgi:hypothetical protein
MTRLRRATARQANDEGNPNMPVRSANRTDSSRGELGPNNANRNFLNERYKESEGFSLLVSSVFFC